MQMAGIKEIKTNPGLISKAIEDHQYLLISKRGKPIAIATALDDKVFDIGLKKWILSMGPVWWIKIKLADPNAATSHTLNY